MLGVIVTLARLNKVQREFYPTSFINQRRLELGQLTLPKEVKEYCQVHLLISEVNRTNDLINDRSIRI